MDTVHERITTVEDGPDTVNERLSTGGPGPEGQEDTVHERLSGVDEAETAEQTEEPADEVKAPAESASKGEWVDYAVVQGADRDEASATTKDKLIEQYGS